MSRYDWLRAEAGLVPRRKFFLFKPVPPERLRQFELPYGPLPPDFREFAQEFGEASLFREFESASYYWLHILAPPKIVGEAHGIIFMKLGWLVDSGDATYHWTAGKFENDGMVFGEMPSKQKRAESFEDWLKRSFARARKQYSQEQWAQLRRPVPPFTEQEKQLVAAMQLFEVRKLGLSASGKILYEVTNNSAMEVPWLSFRVRWPGSWGGGALPTAGIKPGTTKVVEWTFYEGIADQNQIELFPKPPPEPEDRQYNAALRMLSQEPQTPGVLPVNTQSQDRSSPDSSYGSWKFMHEITLNDLREHPIWLWCMQLGLPDEADGPIGGDETSMRPLLESNEVPLDHGAPPLVLLKVAGTDYYASGLYAHASAQITSISIYVGEQRVPPRELACLPRPAMYVAVPLIDGRTGVRFRALTDAPGTANKVDLK